MRNADTDMLVLGAMRKALGTMLLIHAGRIEVFGTGYVIDLTADIQRLRTALALLEAQTEPMH
jgi:hypothetical protein